MIIRNTLILFSILFTLPFAHGQQGLPSNTVTEVNTSTPRQSLRTFFRFMENNTDANSFVDSAAQTFYLKSRSSKQAHTLSSKLYAYIQAQGYFIDILSAPDTSNYFSEELDQMAYMPFPEEPEIYLVKRGQEWLWSRVTIRSIPGKHAQVFPPDEFGQGDDHDFSLSNPYNTIISHIYFLLKDKENQYHPDSSAMTLYHPNPKSEEAQVLARQLLEYYNGQGYYIQPDYLPDDPNYIDTLTGKHIYHPVPEVDEIYVIKVGRKWVYSQRTVRAIPTLHAETYPLGTLDWIPEWAKGKFLGLKTWQWIGIFTLIIVLVLVHRLFTILIRLLLKNVVNRFIKETIAQNFFERVARPLSLLLVSGILVKVIPILQLSIGLNRWLMLGLRVLTPIFMVMIFYYLVDMVAAFMTRRADKTEGTMDDQLVPLVRKILKSMVVVIGFIFILSRLGVNVTALLAGLSIGGLALALASQDTVKNFLGSIMIFLDRPFQVGDWIIASGQEGIVEEVSVRSTRIRTFANSLIYIPNGTLADNAVNNMGLRVYRRFFMKIGVTYDTPPEVVEVFTEGIKTLIETHPFTRKDYYEVHFNDMSNSSLDILVYAFFEVDSWTKELQGRHDLLLGFMKLAERLGVSFAFPTQTLHIENMPGQPSLTPEYPHKQTEYTRLTKEYLEEFKAEVNLRMADRTDDPSKFAGNANG